MIAFSNVLLEHQQEYLRYKATSSTGSADMGNCIDQRDEVQDFNNQACVNIATGNYSKANLLLTLAYQKHAQENNTNDNGGGSSSSSSNNGTCYDSDFTVVDADMDDASDEENDDDDDDDSDDGEYNELFNDSKNSSYEQHIINTQATTSTSSNSSFVSTETGWESSILTTDALPSATTVRPTTNNNSDEITVTAAPPLRRMTTNSNLRTIPYCSQRNQYQQRDDYNHQVFCLPIAMSEVEWATSSKVERSFVLIFNIALCYHLWGMDVLSCSSMMGLQQHQQQFVENGHYEPQQQAQLFAQQLFQEAKTLYLLLAGHDGDVYVLDKFCYPAIFNNMSHVCKSLDGYNSYEAYRYDTLLLKSVRLMIESAANTPTVSASSSNTNYYEDDSDIIESFMENVFYLHGVPENTVPAKAA